MKFKFFQNNTPTSNLQYIPIVPIGRRYVGLNDKGNINWVHRPVVQVNYLEEVGSFDPINVDGIPQLALQMYVETRVLMTFMVNTLSQFLIEYQNSYILILDIEDHHGNIYDQYSRDIPHGGPLRIRGCTFQ